MTVPANPDGAEDVNDFLQRIRDLGENRDKDDEERTRKLEEEIIQGRKERQARRAERARSIAESPTLNAFRLSASSLSQVSAIEPPEQLEPTLQTSDLDISSPSSPNHGRGSSVTDLTQENDSSTAARALPSMSRSRAGTLSWQQRPSSRGLGNTSPGAMSPSRSSHLRNASTASDMPELSRAQIAQSLSSKDPAWFRQTPERGIGSPALRRPESRSGSPTDLGPGRPLPGLSRPSTAEAENIGETETKPPAVSRPASTIGDSPRISSVLSAAPASGLASPVTLTGPTRLDPSQSDTPNDHVLPSPTQRRMSPERTRSTSPTKGMGGFVQSAMMRRSDSVSKRWSAQLPQGLTRSNSIRSNRSSVAGPILSTTVSDLSPLKSTGLGGEVSPAPLQQRPSSSDSDAEGHSKESAERPTTPSASVHETRAERSPSRPDCFAHSRSASSMTADSGTGDTPSSPFTSRTMDPRRWSPTKATWLESALNRPESPRAQKPPPPEQPSWVRDRQNRASVDIGRLNNFKEVTPVGLMRTPRLVVTSSSRVFLALQCLRFTKSQTVEPESSSNSTTTTPVAVTAHSSPDGQPSLTGSPVAAPKDRDVESPTPRRQESQVKSEESLSPSTLLSEEDVRSGEPKAQLRKTPGPAFTRKSPPPPLSTKPNFSLPLREPPLSKPKPHSPVVDFRANLRKREVTKETGPQAEPEFKNVFGKLRKAETRNYVPPDELKGNILRGKAALNVTGGPIKSPRVDDLKESILKRKEEMKAGGGTIRRNTIEEKDAPPVVIPEALVKRQSMASNTSSKREDAGSAVIANVPDSPSSVLEKRLSPSPPTRRSVDVTLPDLSSSIDSHQKAESESTKSVIPNKQEWQSRVNPTSREIEDTHDEPDTRRDSATSLRGLPSSRRSIPTSPVANPYSPVKGKLANRINPALSGILARGPSPKANSSSQDMTVSSPQEGSSASPAAPLTHMTKARARGPKRRLPGSSAAPATSPSVSSAQNTTEVGANSTSEVLSPQPLSESKVSLEPSLENVPRESPVLDTESAQAVSPITDNHDPGNRASSSHTLTDSATYFRLDSISPLSPVSPISPVSLISTPEVNLGSFVSDHSNKENIDQDQYDLDNVTPALSPISVRGSFPPKPSMALSSNFSSSPSTPVAKPQCAQTPRYSSPSSPSPLRTSFKDNYSVTPATPPQKPLPAVSVAAPSPHSKALPSPPVPTKQSNTSLNKPRHSHKLSRKMSAPSLVAQAAEARDILGVFFKSFPNPKNRMDIDPQLMLTKEAETIRLRTLKNITWELTGDGKRYDMPTNQEYVLYEGSMYLCVHRFEIEGQSGTEVYLWCGDDVEAAALESAQVYARKISRDSGCKLAVVRQGKEPVRFIQALGGILITRRGANSRSNSSALYMLCGRKHMGQMVFDEVDYSLRSLCSGFPFVISAPFGKVYLWKGRGSSPEETGAARLISMDLGLTGEFEECDEGEEPEWFFEDFAGSHDANPLLSSAYWALKPKYAQFRTRLLRVDHELAQPTRFWMRRPGAGSPVVRPNDTVQEIEAFCCRDVTEKGVYVLDTYFEIYVIVGDQAFQKSADFASAVVFAHEYGILAASLQDRPFIPKSFVSLGGIPDRCQSAFRKWSSNKLGAPCVFPLDVVIEAIRSFARGD
ncbi:hypothetical protein N7539_002864 [Penicillium diatomitis]|uniref:Gelsolin repeat protein n=1 Tax=Penicillium diatomitis TaxID=2819901 RepID=A0A9W9XFP7_9EURO|nr:uncharacterized protein N7539_002864 [Penicillium diatomitis]KAJ5491297.1 hypothetical protein N7539_002864 [Penicillium diatomitis]